jgi:serine/threonine protein kinase
MSLTNVLKALPAQLASKYECVKLLAVGAYALVYQIQSRSSQKKFALKVIEKHPMEIRLLMPQLRREVETLKVCTNMPHVVRLHECIETPTHIFLRFELCRTSLEDLCIKKGAMEEEDAFMWARQTCLALREMHAHGIIHRDVKPSNLLMDKKGYLRLCDFGFVCREQDRLTGFAGSPQYSAPEASAQNTPYHTTKVDVYSLGASLQHLLLGRNPNGPNDMPKGMSAAASDVLAEMMDPDPDERPTIEELLENPLFGGLDASFEDENILVQLQQQWIDGWQNLIGL